MKISQIIFRDDDDPTDEDDLTDEDDFIDEDGLVELCDHDGCGLGYLKWRTCALCQKNSILLGTISIRFCHDDVFLLQWYLSRAQASTDWISVFRLCRRTGH